MQIVNIERPPHAPPLAQASYEGVVKNVSLALLPDLQVGDYVLVQFGLATSRLEPEQAQQALELLRQLDAYYAEEELT